MAVRIRLARVGGHDAIVGALLGATKHRGTGKRAAEIAAKKAEAEKAA